MSTVALETFAAPLMELLERDGVSELSVNRPGEVWLEVGDTTERHEMPRLTLDHLKQLARLAAQYTEQLISEEHPLLSGTLPGGYRIQVVYPPALEPNTIALSIRRQTLNDMSLTDWMSQLPSPQGRNRVCVDSCLRDLDGQEQRTNFIRTAVAKRKNILISGGTSSGKTTFLNACLKEIPSHERIITIEDAREVHPPHPNRLHLLASRGEQGRAKVTTRQLLEASLRLRPDRIILGEIRGTECVTYWSAINSGHPGSLTSIHADTPQLAFEKLVMLGMQAGLGFTRDHIVDYLRHTVDVVVQLRRDADGQRYISDVWDVSAPLH
ncbi:MAG: P-type DNA transfer ATPase VirB11 [Burkholderiales bacterium]|nr:P-type DNA transfer ATPase VirB11 [Burkholderiales bacterium]